MLRAQTNAKGRNCVLPVPAASGQYRWKVINIHLSKGFFFSSCMAARARFGLVGSQTNWIALKPQFRAGLIRCVYIPTSKADSSNSNSPSVFFFFPPPPRFYSNSQVNHCVIQYADNEPTDPPSVRSETGKGEEEEEEPRVEKNGVSEREGGLSLSSFH